MLPRSGKCKVPVNVIQMIMSYTDINLRVELQPELLLLLLLQKPNLHGLTNKTLCFKVVHS